MEVYLKLSKYDRVLLGDIPSLSAIDEIILGLEDADSDLKEFLQVLDRAPITPLPENYRRMSRLVGASGKAALMLVPKARLKSHLQNCFRSIQDVLCDPENADYLVTYLSIKRCLQSLSRASVDAEILRQKIESTEHEAVRASLKSLTPEIDGKSSPVIYSLSGTATGRLTVTKGPKILTLPADARKCLKSRFPRGRILQIDLISAEPKFALHVGGISPPKDVYKHVAKTILDGLVSRDQAKLITLCALYGQSIKKLEQQLPDGIGARGVVQKTKKYFDREHLLSRLKFESSNGQLRNAVGRPLSIPDDNPHLMVSYYLQSSVAEGSILMFSRFMEETQLRCVPLFVIHDALIIDCDERAANDLLGKDNLYLQLGDWKFDAEATSVGG